jgi:hypothetical protein
MACESYSDFLLDHFSSWQAQQVAASTQPNPAQVSIVNPRGQVVSFSMQDFAAWWSAQDKHALLAAAGGWRATLNWWVGMMAFWSAFTSLGLGVIWSVALLARRRKGLLLAALLIMLVAAAFSTIPIIDWTAQTPTWYSLAARSQIGPVVLAAALLWGFAWLATGMMIGRAVARAMVQLMLPPRMRSSLATLWLTDGLAPPSVRAAKT